MSLSDLILPITIAVAVLGGLLVFVPPYVRKTLRRNAAQSMVEMPCPVCQQHLTIPAIEFNEIKGPEKALVVTQKPEVQGHKLLDYRCPHCEAYLIFTGDTPKPNWILTNPFEAQATSAHCTSCRRLLERPSWPKGQYDQRLDEAQDLRPEHGLRCSRCDAVCCVACCRTYSKGRAADGSFLCPQCFRGPVDSVYHF